PRRLVILNRPVPCAKSEPLSPERESDIIGIKRKAIPAPPIISGNIKLAPWDCGEEKENIKRYKAYNPVAISNPILGFNPLSIKRLVNCMQTPQESPINMRYVPVLTASQPKDV